MSRSRKYPMKILTNQIDKDFDHRRVRRHVKSALQTMDYNDPPIIDIEADTRSLGFEEWGTKFGFNVSEILNEDSCFNNELKEKFSRK